MKRRKRNYKSKQIRTSKVSPSPIYLGEIDRITYVYENDMEGNCVKVINVSYEIKVKVKWYLVSRYDSEHGFLHCHMRISTKDTTEVLLNRSSVVKNGSPKDWLTWAIRDFRLNFFKYRKGFLKRSGIDSVY